MRNAIVTVIIFFAVNCWSTGETSLTDLLGPSLSSRLIKEGEIRRSFTSKAPLTLIPDLPLRENIMSDVTRLDPTVGVELLFLYKPPHSVISSGNFHLAIYNTLRSISTLKGIEYYSASRKKMRIFLHDAYVIDSPKTRGRIQDPLVKTIPAEETLFTIMKDSSLGDYVAKIDFIYTENAFAMNMENWSDIWQFIIRVAKSGRLKTYVLLVPFGDKILFYGLSCIRTTNLFGIARRKSASFDNRLISLLNWFKTNLEG